MLESGSDASFATPQQPRTVGAELPPARQMRAASDLRRPVPQSPARDRSNGGRLASPSKAPGVEDAATATPLGPGIRTCGLCGPPASWGAPCCAAGFPLQFSFPLTAAGQFRFFTGFPVRTLWESTASESKLRGMTPFCQAGFGPGIVHVGTCSGPQFYTDFTHFCPGSSRSPGPGKLLDSCRKPVFA